MSEHYESGVIGSTGNHADVQCFGTQINVAFYSGVNEEGFRHYVSTMLPPDIAIRVGEHLINAAKFATRIQEAAE